MNTGIVHTIHGKWLCFTTDQDGSLNTYDSHYGDDKAAATKQWKQMYGFETIEPPVYVMFKEMNKDDGYYLKRVR